MDKRFETYCGLTCSTCNYKEPCNCKGCIASDGHPFHGECKVAECAKSKNVRFCGECWEFPCELLKSYSYDKENGDDGKRIEACQELKKVLVAEARVGIDPVSVCGHHCDYCLYVEKCGGCRSDYNCCSYATLFEDKKCPNVVCAYEKKQDGCYDCEELETCKKGFYSAINGENEFACKAKAIMVRTYGKEVFGAANCALEAAGIEVIEEFYKSKSVEEALAMLEKYNK